MTKKPKSLMAVAVSGAKQALDINMFIYTYVWSVSED